MQFFWFVFIAAAAVILIVFLLAGKISVKNRLTIEHVCEALLGILSAISLVAIVVIA